MIYFGIVLITLLTIAGGVIEDSRKFLIKKQLPLFQNSNNVKIVYECFNIHLTLSLGLLGLFWEKSWTSPKILMGLFLLFIIGITSKAALSNHEPEMLSWRDRDFFVGFIIPNVCAFATLVAVIFFNIFMGGAVK